jgi:hypothetical protein
VRIFKNPWFARFASKEGIQDSELKEIVNNVLEAGQADVDLGSGVYKMRLARPREGKSSGFRIILFFRSRDKTFYHYAYPKASRENISEKELLIFKKLAKEHLAMTYEQLTEAVKAGELIEI